MENYRILVVDDEQDIIEFICYNLKKEGFQVFSASNGIRALEEAVKVKPHLILLDVMMPEMDGIETCSELRKLKDMQKTVIAFLTARSEDYSQIAGFEAGADDYISKPIRPKVLVSRIKALLKRYETPGVFSNETQFTGNKNLSIDRERYLVIFNGEELNLPKKEFELLSLLESKPGRVFTREEIYDIIWGDEVIVGDRTIDVHIRKLREKLGDERIVTIKGVGYKYMNR